TMASVDASSLIVAHPPLPSALAKVDESLSLHFWTFVGSFTSPVAASLESRFRRQAVFLPAALIFVDAHFCPGVDAALAGPAPAAANASAPSAASRTRPRPPRLS